MSQNSLTLPTTGVVSGLQMTQATNQALDTLNTLASGATAPSSPEAGQFWHDTTTNTLKLRSLDNTTWIPFVQLNESAFAATPYSAAVTSGGNRIVNGGMVLDQFNEGASYTISTGGTFVYTADQWEVICKSSTASGVTAQRVTDAPAGFTNSLKITVGTGASSVASTDLLQIVQPVESQNVSDFGYGASTAMAASLSFWVKSSITGTFSAVLANVGGARTFVTTFGITSANTWQKIIIPNIPGDQSGTWPTDNTQGLSITFSIAAGAGEQTSTLNAWQSGAFLAANTQTNTVLTTSAATFQLTGVMLNLGAFCAPYEKRVIQTELQLCQRYFEKSYDAGVAIAAASFPSSFGVNASSTSTEINSPISPKRADPTVTLYSPNTGTSGKAYDSTASADVTVAAFNSGQRNFNISFTSTAGHVYNMQWTANARM